jgi:hypothetical protein
MFLELSKEVLSKSSILSSTNCWVSTKKKNLLEKFLFGKAEGLVSCLSVLF